MKRIIKYICEKCNREYLSPIDAELCEKRDKELHEEHQKRVGEENEWIEKGHDIWYENSGMKHAPIVDKYKFGDHDYGYGYGTSDCKYGCGCWMGPTRSGGPVNPFGKCPKNPIVK
jgi:hypothetical protein